MEISPCRLYTGAQKSHAEAWNDFFEDVWAQLGDDELAALVDVLDVDAEAAAAVGRG